MKSNVWSGRNTNNIRFCKIKRMRERAKEEALTELSEEESSFSAEVRRLEVALSEKNKLMLEARNEKSRAEFKFENVQEQILGASK